MLANKHPHKEWQQAADSSKQQQALEQTAAAPRLAAG